MQFSSADYSSFPKIRYIGYSKLILCDENTILN